MSSTVNERDLKLMRAYSRERNIIPPNKIHKSKKEYKRKPKHWQNWLIEKMEGEHVEIEC